MNQLTTFFLIILSFCAAKNIDEIEYPVPPKTEERLFYIQRNHNKNTIVYDANFDKEGNLITTNPIKVYWIRYEENGQRMELRKIEKIFAYGVKCKVDQDHDKQYNVDLVSNNIRDLKLIQKASFKASIYVLINNKLSELDHMFVYADNSGLWPKVKYIELYGKDLKSGEDNYEKILN